MINFIKEINGVYVFEIYENDRLVEIANVGANSKKEAQSIIENRAIPNPIDGLKSQLKNEAKQTTKSYLESTDYLVIRHIEQTTLNVVTSLTSAEYTALLTKRNKARIDSNNEEASIEAETDLTELKKIRIAEKGK